MAREVGTLNDKGRGEQAGLHIHRHQERLGKPRLTRFVVSGGEPSAQTAASSQFKVRRNIPRWARQLDWIVGKYHPHRYHGTGGFRINPEEGGPGVPHNAGRCGRIHVYMPCWGDNRIGIPPPRAIHRSGGGLSRRVMGTDSWGDSSYSLCGGYGNA